MLQHKRLKWNLENSLKYTACVWQNGLKGRRQHTLLPASRQKKAPGQKTGCLSVQRRFSGSDMANTNTAPTKQIAGCSYKPPMVEARGVEPLSESASTGTSPSADGRLHSLIQPQAVKLLNLVES